MTGRYHIQGHAIVSADDRIADDNGMIPPALRNAADWLRFQAALNAAAVTVLGRVGHELNPNVGRRNRLVLSSGAKGVEHRAGVWWWNPGHASLDEALAKAAPAGGIVAVPGGRRVYDLFLRLGFDEFHLARAEQARLPGGTAIFSDVLQGRTADEILAARGLRPSPREALDPAAGVTLVVWRKHGRLVIVDITDSLETNAAMTKSEAKL